MVAKYDKLIDEIIDKRPSVIPKMSIVIVTYNRPQILLKCLDSLKKQSFNDFEIIIIDNGGNEKIKNEIIQYNVLYIKMIENIAVPLARNIGASHTTSLYIGFIDDDAICDLRLIENAIKTFDSFKDVVAIRGKIIPKSKKIFNKMQSHYDLGNKPIYGYYHECCCFFKRDAWINLSYYSDNVYNKNLGQGHEGLIVVYGIGMKYGIKALLYQPSMVVYHDYAAGLKHYLNKKKNHKKAIENYRNHFPEIINFYEKKYHPDKVSPNVLKRKLGDKILIRMINIILKVYLKYNSN